MRFYKITADRSNLLLMASWTSKVEYLQRQGKMEEGGCSGSFLCRDLFKVEGTYYVVDLIHQADYMPSQTYLPFYRDRPTTIYSREEGQRLVYVVALGMLLPT